MIIENKELIKFTTGFLRVWENDGFLSFSRFTEKQEKIILERDFGAKAYASSSMKLEFITDADNFSFDYRITPGSNQNVCSIDVLTNGLHTHHIFQGNSDFTGTFSADLEPVGKKRVTVYFPNLTKMEIKNFNINGQMEIHPHSLKYLALGDSITQGYVSKHAYLTYVNIVGEALNAEVLNQGIGGDIFFEGNIDETASKVFDPDLITVAYGTNDWSRGVNVYEGAFAYFKKLREAYPNAKILALSPIWRGGIKGELRRDLTLEEVRSDILKAAEENNIIPINARDFVNRYEDYFADKTLHPNDLGFIFYGQNLIKEIKKHI